MCIGRKKRKTNAKKYSSNAKETAGDPSPGDAEETAGDPSLLSGAAVVTLYDPSSSVRTSPGNAETSGASFAKTVADFSDSVASAFCVFGSGGDTSNMHTVVSDLLVQLESSNLSCDSFVGVPVGLLQRILESGTKLYSLYSCTFVVYTVSLFCL